ncbi:MAG: archease [Deltaproteobacteria bacterium]|nr:archease [Deltaproteobacteria bacterium]
MSFEILPHTADVRVKVVGQSLEELFLESLEGMNELMCVGFRKQQTKITIQKTLKITALNSTMLLVYFLSEVLTLSHIHHAIFCKVEFKKLSDATLEAKIFGTKTKKIEKDIKAVSYHEAKIKKNKNGDHETILVFDI